jgi:two-component system response regulator RegX3
MSERILLVEDDPGMVETVSYALRAEGFDLDVVGDGDQAVTRALSEEYDLLLLDVSLPGLSGVEVCRRVREESVVPIVMVTARDAEVERVLGLESGADDYVTKPFSLAELISRVRAILRRRRLDSAPPVTSIRKVGALELDLIRHRARIEGKPLPLTPSEFRLLALLAEDPERAVSRREIMQHLWESSFVGDQRACDTHILNIRRKVERDPAHPTRLVTVRGLGYQLVAD